MYKQHESQYLLTQLVVPKKIAQKVLLMSLSVSFLWFWFENYFNLLTG